MIQNTFSRQFDFLLGFAKQQLASHSEFYPFASVVEADGEVHALAAHLGTEHPPSRELLDEYDSVIPLLIKEKGIVAAAVCLDAARAGPDHDTDAIVCEIENSAGEALTVLVPYKRTADGFEYSEPIIHERAPKWFVANQ